jgi:hypothetical protein
MTDIRIARAGPHSLALLTDIRDNAARHISPELVPLFRNSFDDLYEHATECSVHYFLGFADHRPFGYVRLAIEEGEAEISGPRFYPEYQTPIYTSSLLEFAIAFLQKQSVRMVYSLARPANTAELEGYADALFEDISDDPEFVRRWHDGILADRAIPSGTRLFVRLLELPDTPADSD